MTNGFFDWRDATRAFQKHDESKVYVEVVEVVVTLLKTTKEVGDSLSLAHRVKKERARNMQNRQ